MEALRRAVHHECVLAVSRHLDVAGLAFHERDTARGPRIEEPRRRLALEFAAFCRIPDTQHRVDCREVVPGLIGSVGGPGTSSHHEIPREASAELQSWVLSSGGTFSGFPLNATERICPYRSRARGTSPRWGSGGRHRCLGSQTADAVGTKSTIARTGRRNRTGASARIRCEPSLRASDHLDRLLPLAKRLDRRRVQDRQADAGANLRPSVTSTPSRASRLKSSKTLWPTPEEYRRGSSSGFHARISELLGARGSQKWITRTARSRSSPGERIEVESRIGADSTPERRPIQASRCGRSLARGIRLADDLHEARAAVCERAARRARSPPRRRC